MSGSRWPFEIEKGKFTKKFRFPALTEKDIRDAKFAIENKVDWIALSFVELQKT